MNALTELSPDVAARQGRQPVLAFVCDDETMAAISRVVPGGRRGVEISDGGVRAAVAMLAHAPSPDLLIVDISEAAAPMSDISALNEIIDRDATLIVLGHQNDVALYRALIDAGAADYLVKPVTSAELRRAILTADAEERTRHEEEKAGGRVAMVIGCRGGVGASTVAVNAAWLLANEHKQSTALVDLDLHFGTAALNLDLEPSHGLRDALSNPDRIDSLFVASALVHDGENLFVLGGEEPLNEDVPIHGQAILALLAELRGTLEQVVVDLPRALMAAEPALLGAAGSIVIVTDLSLTGLRDALRIYEMAATAAPNADITLVANRTGLAKKMELTPAEFEKNLQTKFDVIIPEDQKSAALAAGAKPFAVTGRSGKSGAALRALTKRIGGLDDGGERKVRKGLFGGGKKKAEQKRKGRLVAQR